MTNEKCVRQMRRVYALLLSLDGKEEEQIAGGEGLDSDTQAATDDALAEELAAQGHWDIPPSSGSAG